MHAMQVQIHGKPSFSKDGRHAQVIVLIGEERNRRSFTRHLDLVDGKWFGLNPDPRAIPLNKQYEQELAAAKGDLAAAEATVKSIEKKLKKVTVAPEGDIVAESMLLAAYILFEEQLEIAQASVSFAESEVDEATTKLNIIRRELPLMMEFNPYRDN